MNIDQHNKEILAQIRASENKSVAQETGECEPALQFINFKDLCERASVYKSEIQLDKVCKYGLDILDDTIGGILPSELVVISAHSGVGKSEMAFRIAVKNATEGKNVVLLSLEGDIYETAYRYMQREINNSGENIKTVEYRYNLNPNVEKRERQVIDIMNENLGDNLLIFDKQSIPDIELIDRLIEEKREWADLFIIDHLGYIERKGANVNEELGKIMRKLKRITDVSRTPIVLMAHTRKEGSGAIEKPLSVHDIAGSKDVVNEATTIILLEKLKETEIERHAIRDDIVSFHSFLETQEDSARYGPTRIQLAKSRAGLGNAVFGAIYDLYKKTYITGDKYQVILEGTGISNHTKISSIKKRIDINDF